MTYKIKLSWDWFLFSRIRPKGSVDSFSLPVAWMCVRWLACQTERNPLCIKQAVIWLWNWVGVCREGTHTDPAQLSWYLSKCCCDAKISSQPVSTHLNVTLRLMLMSVSQSCVCITCNCNSLMINANSMRLYSITSPQSWMHFAKSGHLYKHRRKRNQYCM